MSPTRDDREEIVVGVVFNGARDKVLVSRRREGVHLEGTWEFPGGKVGRGESIPQALAREFVEEVNINVARAHPLITVEHDYPDKKIRLSAWIVDEWSGEPKGREGQRLEWIAIRDLSAEMFPDANGRILRSIGLPSLYLITPDLKRYDGAFMRQVEEMIDNGLRLLQFRSKSSPFKEHAGAVRDLVQICERKSCKLLYNGTPEQAEILNAHGVHLNGAALARIDERPLPPGKWVAASCHGAGDISHAAGMGVDFCVLSPVHVSPTHPAGDSIGWGRFRVLSEGAGLPVYALGGIKPGELPEAREHGAHGIAMISAVWNAPDPAAIIRDLSRT